MPDLIVAYANGDATTIVAYPGDIESIYPSPGSARALMATPFLAPRVVATVDGRVDALTAVDADADGLEDGGLALFFVGLNSAVAFVRPGGLLGGVLY